MLTQELIEDIHMQLFRNFRTYKYNNENFWNKIFFVGAIKIIQQLDAIKSFIKSRTFESRTNVNK